jgi:NitT/TauT family transport system substrate-binding protein
LLLHHVFPLLALVATEKLSVILTDKDNLQYLAFWVALGSGEFEKEGLELDRVVATEPIDAERLVRQEKAPIAVLPPPMYVKLVANAVPIVIVARLLQNDPIELVVRDEVIAARKLSRSLPLVDRLRALKGLKLGVAPHPVTRLHALFRSVGLEAKDWVEIVVVPGKEQNDAFEKRKIDALYCHTPFLEKALVEQGASLYVDQAGGEVPALADRQIHTLVVSRRFLQAEPKKTRAIYEAIARAERTIHTDEKAAVDALVRILPERPRKHLETIVHLYRPAVPDSPAPSVAGFERAKLFFPAGSAPPNLEGIDLSAYVFTPPRAGAR